MSSYPIPYQYPGSMPMPQPSYQLVKNEIYPYTYQPQQTTYMAQTSLASNDSAAMEEIVQNLMSLMKGASKEELQQVIDNEDKINELIQDAEQTKKLQRKLKDLVQLNKDLATINISMQPEFELMKGNLLALVKEQKELKEKYDAFCQKISSKISLESTLSILQAATAEKECESEKIPAALMDKKINVEQFMEQFIPQRKHYHLRKIKTEKLLQIIGSRQNRHFPVPRPRTYANSGYGGY